MKRWTQAQAAKALGFSTRGYQDIEAKHGELPLRVTLAVEGYNAREDEYRGADAD